MNKEKGGREERIPEKLRNCMEKKKEKGGREELDSGRMEELHEGGIRRKVEGGEKQKGQRDCRKG